MDEAYICDGIRTPFGKYAGGLASVRTDDLAAIPIKTLMDRHPGVDWGCLDDVVYGCANQAGEDNRNVARMALLLAGLPKDVPGATVNRLCGSSLEAVAIAARAIKAGEASLVIAGGVESMSRAPFVLGKAELAFTRSLKLEDTTLGWRFVNPTMKEKYGTDSMPETAENVAEEWNISRDDQDQFAFRSQRRTAEAGLSGRLAEEVVPVTVQTGKGASLVVSQDEQPRPGTTIEALAKLKPVVKPTGTVTAGNSSGLNDGSGAVILAPEKGAKLPGLAP
ncbi:MAG: acetyl-CoA C-acyltransferase, partial [Acidobacteria bacterium]|nr:acetyl-CoA C-acyltransferase [Acidobacteriota bacterium]